MRGLASFIHPLNRWPEPATPKQAKPRVKHGATRGWFGLGIADPERTLAQAFGRRQLSGFGELWLFSWSDVDRSHYLRPLMTKIEVIHVPSPKAIMSDTTLKICQSPLGSIRSAIRSPMQENRPEAPLNFPNLPKYNSYSICLTSSRSLDICIRLGNRKPSPPSISRMPPKRSKGDLRAFEF